MVCNLCDSNKVSEVSNNEYIQRSSAITQLFDDNNTTLPRHYTACNHVSECQHITRISSILRKYQRLIGNDDTMENLKHRIFPGNYHLMLLNVQHN